MSSTPQKHKPLTRLQTQQLRASQRRMAIVRALGLDPEMSVRDIAEYLGLEYSDHKVQKMLKSDLRYIKDGMNQALSGHDVLPVLAKQLTMVNELRRILMDDLRRQATGEPLTVVEEYEEDSVDGQRTYRKVTTRDSRVEPSTVKAILDCMKTERDMLKAGKIYEAVVDEYLAAADPEREKRRNRVISIEVVPGARPEMLSDGGPVIDADVSED